MTEDEAKTKWCPFVRATSVQGQASYNRNSDPPTLTSAQAAKIEAASRCIGSACMAWREVFLSVGPQRIHPDVLGGAWIGWTITDDTPDAQGCVEISPPGHGVTHGRCGLAGE